MNITNNSGNSLSLPGNDPIPAGATVKVENWDDIKGNDAVALFLKRDVISTGGKLGEAPTPDAVDVSPAAQLAVINARQAAADGATVRIDMQDDEPEQPAKRGRKTNTPAQE